MYVPIYISKLVVLFVLYSPKFIFRFVFSDESSPIYTSRSVFSDLYLFDYYVPICIFLACIFRSVISELIFYDFYFPGIYFMDCMIPNYISRSIFPDLYFAICIFRFISVYLYFLLRVLRLLFPLCTFPTLIFLGVLSDL